MNNSTLKVIIITSLLSCLFGCSGTGRQAPIVDSYETISDRGSHISSLAKGFIGTPYRYGGQDPAGFDCSGLVHYTHRKTGIVVPRTSKGQYAAARYIETDELSPGDVIFFRLSYWRRVSHVGIYAGNGKFIHAPKSGQRVSMSNINTPYWRDRIVKAGRFY